MDPKLILVTGATDGIGRATARALAKQGHRVIVHGRSASKVAEVARALREEAGGEVHESVFDLASLDAVRRGAAELLARFPRLDVLVNNAGVYENERRESEDGLELTFAVNHLAPFLLTHLLLPGLRAAAPSRVVNVASTVHRSGRIRWDDLGMERDYEGYAAYAQSKLMNVLFTRELARRLAGERVTVNALHPGVIATKLLRSGFGMGGAGVERGARTSVYLATSPEVEGVTGRYFNDCAEEEPAPQAQDGTAAKRLWELSARMTGVAS